MDEERPDGSTKDNAASAEPTKTRDKRAGEVQNNWRSHNRAVHTLVTACLVEHGAAKQAVASEGEPG